MNHVFLLGKNGWASQAQLCFIRNYFFFMYHVMLYVLSDAVENRNTFSWHAVK